MKKTINWKKMTKNAMWNLFSICVTMISKSNFEKTITIKFEMCSKMNKNFRTTKTLKKMKIFVINLSIVNKKKLKIARKLNKNCCICLKKYYQTFVDNEKIKNNISLKLKCEHIIENNCLKILFESKN